MATLRLFASAREAAGVARVEIPATTVEELISEAQRRFGDRFSAVVSTSRIWVNGGPAGPATIIADHDVVAVIPPVSGGAQERGLAVDGVRPHLRLVRSDDDVPDGDVPNGDVPHERERSAAPPPGRVGALALGGLPTSYDALARVPLPVVPFPPDRVRAPAVPDVAVVAQPERVAREEASPTAGTPRMRAPLAVVATSDRPHGRLGIVWATVTALALALGSVTLAVWLALGAALAATQTVRVWVARRERPLGSLTVLTAFALPLAAASGLAAMNAVVVAAIVAMLAVRVFRPTRSPIRDVALSLAIGVAIGLAAAAAVYLRTINLGAPMFLLACAAAYDTGAYLVGTGAKSAWEGPVGGIAALVPLTLLAAVALEPPFEGASPMILGVVAAVLAPLGPLAASALLGDRDASAPALRRLDSLLVMGPVWAFWAASLFR